MRTRLTQEPRRKCHGDLHQGERTSRAAARTGGCVKRGRQYQDFDLPREPNAAARARSILLAC
jgi:hypothetical protein